MTPAPSLPAVLAAREGSNAGVPLRPVQYLGNKQRSMPTIQATIARLTADQDVVADLFTGTSVVAQGVAGLGRKVVALDASAACAVMARATLGVDRRDHSVDTANLVDAMSTEAGQYEETLTELFREWVAAEDSALRDKDGETLAEISRTVPQVWRPGPRGRLSPLFEAWPRFADEPHYSCALLTPLFAGTYFSIRQAIALDARRAAIRSLVTSRLIDSWEEAVLVTSLLSAASAAAFSPGKHFAQPHKLDPGKDLRFHQQRLLTDRKVSIAATAEKWVVALVEGGRSGAEDHAVLERRVEELTATDLRQRGVRLVYADPPYTAQQYSRFYHLLDTLATGQARPLDLPHGRVTSGLYPVGRYLSPFCSKRQARAAFQNLAAVCKKAQTTLLLSYSSSSKDSTGNERMISLPALCQVLGSAYGASAVETLEFEHTYRQFNNGDVARSNRSDPEVLVIAHAS